MERLAGITIERLTDLAGRLFFDTVPTLSAIGPLEQLVSAGDITRSLTRGTIDRAASWGLRPLSSRMPITKNAREPGVWQMGSSLSRRVLAPRARRLQPKTTRPLTADWMFEREMPRSWRARSSRALSSRMARRSATFFLSFAKTFMINSFVLPNR